MKKHYKLLKDLPTFKKGDLFYIDEFNGCLYYVNKKDHPGHWKKEVMAYHKNTLDNFPNILADWFVRVYDEVDQCDDIIDLGDRDIIKLKTLPLELAGHDLRIGDKTEFTWDEAVEKTKNLVDWRLPTAHEWVLIAEELALAEDGKLDGRQMLEKMGVEDYCGYWWSSTSLGSSYAFHLYVRASGGVYPRDLNNHSVGLSVRLVREVENGD